MVSSEPVDVVEAEPVIVYEEESMDSVAELVAEPEGDVDNEVVEESPLENNDVVVNASE